MLDRSESAARNLGLRNLTEQEFDAVAGGNVAVEGLMTTLAMAGTAFSIGLGLMLTVAYWGVLGAARNHP
jgi:hypothetical protein